MSRVGLLGGTFDPPHRGHIAAAVAAKRALALDRVLLVVANEPWQKVPHQHVSPADDRLSMVEAAVARLPGVEACRIEIDHGGPSYTVDTVKSLLSEAERSGGSGIELYLVIGADLVSTLPTWRQVEELQRLVTLAVVARPGSTAPDPPGWRIARVEGGEAVDVSSSEIRQRLERGLDVGDLVPAEVIRCIERRGLYAVSR